MLIDSGADINTLSTDAWFEVMRAWEKGEIELNELQWGESNRPLKAYAASTPLQVEASFLASIQVEGGQRETKARIYAIQGAEKSLLGRKTATLLEVLRLGLNVLSCRAGRNFPKNPGSVGTLRCGRNSGATLLSTVDNNCCQQLLSHPGGIPSPGACATRGNEKKGHY